MQEHISALSTILSGEWRNELEEEMESSEEKKKIKARKFKSSSRATGAFEFQVPWGLANNPECPCGEQSQTMDHILRGCRQGPACTDEDLREVNNSALTWIKHWRDKIWMNESREKRTESDAIDGWSPVHLECQHYSEVSHVEVLWNWSLSHQSFMIYQPLDGRWMCTNQWYKYLKSFCHIRSVPLFLISSHFFIRHTHWVIKNDTIVRFTQLCSKFPPTALLNFACDG